MGNTYLIGEFESGSFTMDSIQDVPSSALQNISKKDIFIARYDADGHLKWLKGKGGLNQDYGEGIALVKNRKLYITGAFASQIIFNMDTLITGDLTDNDPFVAAFDTSGNEIGAVSIRTPGNSLDKGKGIDVDGIGFFNITGYQYSDSMIIGSSQYKKLPSTNAANYFYAKGCPVIGFNIVNVDTPTCTYSTNGAIDIEMVGTPPDVTYMWSNNQETQDLTGIPSGHYSLTATYANGQCSKSWNIEIPGAPEIIEDSVKLEDVTSCDPANGKINIYATGGHGGKSNLLYSIDNGITFQESSMFDSLLAGIYQIAIKDTNDCVLQGSVDTIINTLQTITIDSVISSDISCAGFEDGKIIIHTTGNDHEFSIDGGINFQMDSAFSSLKDGYYKIVVQDTSTGCAQMGSNVKITNPDSIQISSLNYPDSLSCSDDAGAISISATGGTGTLWYIAYNPDSTANTSGLFALSGIEEYIIAVTDENQCGPVYDTINIHEPEPLEISYQSTNVSGEGASDGTITIAATGGTPPYSYSIDGNNWQVSSNSFTELTAGSYTIHVTDANSCGPVTEDPVEITKPSSIGSSFTELVKLYPNPSTGNVTISNIPKGRVIIDIISITGQVVFSGITNKSNLQLSLDPGIFLVKINGEILKDKIIIH